MDWLTEPQALVGLLTLTVLEIVLGIDNIVFISILVGKLPAREQGRARTIGLGLAMLTRIALLFSLSWIMRLTTPLFAVLGFAFSGRDLILIGGGLFLIGKSTHEIHQRLEGAEEEGGAGRRGPSFVSVLVQIALLDIIFSLDSVITAVGMVERLAIMVTAVVLAVGFMLVFAAAVSNFVHRHPTVKMLALSFLLLIGTTLIVEGFHQHVSKGYVYTAMAFSVFVELLNLRLRKKSKPVQLHEAFAPDGG
ncbi:MAG TPA: TerC family protein [Pyrinomonadaceae bacterium]|jgi:predicted tellurium resistance membrane protein TerC